MLRAATFSGEPLGTITLADKRLITTSTAISGIVRTYMRRYHGNAKAAYDALNGLNNGYITISEDKPTTISGQVRVAAGGAGSK